MSECRLDRLTSQQAAERLAVASVAYVPIGSIEYHGPHLPMGVDMVTALGVCTEAARRSGGVVLPPSYLANGCLDLPHTLTFEPALVEVWTRSVVEQLHHRGVGVVVLLTGHGPLDLIHLLKRVARESDGPEARAYGLCWLELNAALLPGPEQGEPTVIDHASTVETSWMLALEPDLVHLGELPQDPAGASLGVYGLNPRFTASAESGMAQISACAELLADRVGLLAAGTWADADQDLEAFVDLVWPEPLTMLATSSTHGPLTLSVVNSGRASRYLSAVHAMRVDGTSLASESAWCANASVGETGERVRLASLHRERGLYVRRGQVLKIVIPDAPKVTAGCIVELEVELGGVRRAQLLATVTEVPDDHSSVTALDGGHPSP
ncbi:MAG: creatininase family protein [Candidatus Nanopelagicales bacterium]|nr:creatininase family protein [Candidatus Nanopelagicales bacterium]